MNIQIDPACLEPLEKNLAPIAKQATEAMYSSFMEMVQDYLIENVEYNISSSLASARAEADYQRRQVSAVTTQRDALFIALSGVMQILGTAESNASGNPEWDYVGPRVAAARTAIAQVAERKAA